MAHPHLHARCRGISSACFKCKLSRSQGTATQIEFQTSSAISKELLHKLGYKQEQAAQHSGSRNSTTKQQRNEEALIQAAEKCCQDINRVADLMASLVEKEQVLPPAMSC
jgi:hypothetical protein